MKVTVAVTDDLETCLAIRAVVFMEEQGVSEEDELDGKDAEATHFLATYNGDTVGTGRIGWAKDTAKIGRVAVYAQARGHGIGTALIKAAVAETAGKPGVKQALLGAQTHALGFYEQLGFTAFGPIYDDAGIPHRDMLCPL